MKAIDTKSINVLIVDDYREIIKLLQSMLSESHEYDFHTNFAVSLNEAFEIINNNNFDIILLDLNLPDSIGLKTLHVVRENYPNIPIIILPRPWNNI